MTDPGFPRPRQDPEPSDLASLDHLRWTITLVDLILRNIVVRRRTLFSSGEVVDLLLDIRHQLDALTSVSVLEDIIISLRKEADAKDV